jgi:arylsulfatase A-like enzyme
MFIGHKAPHSFYTPEPKYEHTFDNVRVPYPATAFQLDGKPAWIKQRLYTWHGIYGPLFEWRKKFPDDRPEAVKDFENMVHGYWGTVLSVDDSVGRLRHWLEETQQLDNTIIVFMGDNGLLEGEHGMVDKRTAHEPSLRIPLIVRYPALTKASKVITQQVLTVDMASSLLELCGAPALPKIARQVLGEARAKRRSCLAHELVLPLQLREAVPLHAERPRHPHRRLEIHPLPAWRRQFRQAHGRALQSEERSRRNQEPHQRSEGLALPVA